MNSPQKTLGAFLPIMDQYYQTDFWQGIRKSAQDLGYNINIDDLFEEADRHLYRVKKEKKSR